MTKQQSGDDLLPRVVAFVFICLVFPFPLTWIWNGVVVPVFGLPPLAYAQVFALHLFRRLVK